MLTNSIASLVLVILAVSSSEEKVPGVKQGGRCLKSSWKKDPNDEGPNVVWMGLCKIFPRLPKCPPPPPGQGCDNSKINLILTKITSIEEKSDECITKKSIQGLRDDIIEEIKNQFDEQETVINKIELNTDTIIADIADDKREAEVVAQNVDTILSTLAAIRQMIMNKNDAVPRGGVDLNTVAALVTNLNIRVVETSTKQMELLIALQRTVLGMEGELSQINSRLLEVVNKVVWIANNLSTGSSVGNANTCNNDEILRIYQIDQQLLSLVNIIAQESRNSEALIRRLLAADGNQNQPTIQAVLAICQGLKVDLTKLTETIITNFNEYQTQFTKTTTIIETVSRDVRKANEHFVTYYNSARALACKDKGEE